MKVIQYHNQNRSRYSVNKGTNVQIQTTQNEIHERERDEQKGQGQKEQMVLLNKTRHICNRTITIDGAK